MKIRDLHATINGNKETFTMPSGGIEIVADDGKTLFSIRQEGNDLLLSSGQSCKNNGELLRDDFVIKPRASNCVGIIKVKYEVPNV